MGRVLSFSPSAAADVYLLPVLLILKHCYSSFHPFSNFQQVHFCKYSPEVESMEAAKSQFSYICLSCQVLLKERECLDPRWKSYLKLLGAVMGNTTAFDAGEEGNWPLG